MSDEIVFLTVVSSPKEKSGARLLIESARQFGGEMGGCPFWVFEAGDMRASCADLTPLGVELFPLDAPASIKDYTLSEKVIACHQAEKMALSGAKTFVWMDPNCIVVQPPLLFDLGDSFDAAMRPVHIRNVGLTLDSPVDEFWRGIYSAVGVDDVRSAVDSFVDGQRLRSYFNTHAFSFNPRLGLMRKWYEKFEALAQDSSFQKRACKDDAHQVFLFQAILSALLAASIPAERLRILPPTYNYPYNLYARIPAEKRVKSLNELTCFTYEGREINPGSMTDVDIHEPLRSWLDYSLLNGR